VGVHSPGDWSLGEFIVPHSGDGYSWLAAKHQQQLGNFFMSRNVFLTCLAVHRTTDRPLGVAAHGPFMG
jgi:hypothetical protein